ncbi:exosortase A [Novosphingobium colocasiae]|uniref:exosortase A n=1 Tax=Novosphingobium colocasiae TaxID=1256513 RepID=UPI0035AEC412
MQLDARILSGRLIDWQAVPAPWRAALLRLGAAWLVLIVLFGSDWLAMLRQWWDISTYNHILLIPVIIGWLALQRRRELARIAPQTWWPGLLLLGGAAFLWLLGAVSGLDLARQAGAVAMLGACVPLLLGVRAAWGLLFPLCYMAFLIPVGEELVPLLQTVTAKITIALTHFSGIPARIDGVFIDTPAGLFQVAEACSGVKFLIAMIAFGVLTAHVCFVSAVRRAVLLAVCLVVPILANGARAWGTIFAAQYVGVEVAGGIDHIIYGWVFFAVVLAIVIAAAWPFFDRRPDAAMIDSAAINTNPLLTRLAAARIGPVAGLCAIALVVVTARGWAMAAEDLAAPMPDRIDLPVVAGWQRVDYTPRIWWEPRAEGADHRLLGRYAGPDGMVVDVFLALYAGQGEGREAGGFGQGALMPGSAWAWQSAAANVDGGLGERLMGGTDVERVAVTWYRTGDLTTASNARLKLAAMADHLLLRARPTMMLILSAEDRRGAPAQRAIDRFRKDSGPLDMWMDRMARLR